MNRILSGSLEFKCTAAGANGPLVILLHGFGGGPLDWHHAVPGLSEKHRLLIPNLTPFFTSSRPIGFSKQIEVLSGLINQLNPTGEPFVLAGTSYGGTLSFGLRAHFQSLVSGHVLINPMPLDPLSSLKSGQLRMLFGLNMVPGALPLYLKTKAGQEHLFELGSVFGFGGQGRKGLEGGLSERKLNLVAKAVQRFAWIAQNEDWTYWNSQLKDHVIPLLLVTGGQDPLFHERDFRSYQQIVPLSEHLPVSSGEHMLVRTHGAEVAEILAKFIKSLESEGTVDSATLRHAI